MCEKVDLRVWKSGNPISDSEHEKNYSKLTSVQKKAIADLTSGTNLFPRIRKHNDNTGPCVYLFRNEELARCKLGRVCCVNLEKTQIKLVLNKFEDSLPVSKNEWDGMNDEKSFNSVNMTYEQVEDIAKPIILRCIETFDRIYKPKPTKNQTETCIKMYHDSALTS